LTVNHPLQGTITTVLGLQGAFFVLLTGQINCNSTPIKPITRLGKMGVPRAAFLPAAQGTLRVPQQHLDGQINCVNTIIGSCNLAETLIGRVYLESSLADIPIAGECIIIGSLSLLAILPIGSIDCVSNINC